MTVPCAILGDSLAAGVAAFRPDCLSDTKVGISTSAYLRAHMTSVSADTVLISLGVNDGDADPDTADRLAGLRLEIKAARVYWILPARSETTRRIVRDIAHTFGDGLIETRGYTGSDGLHLSPRTYRAIALVFDLFGERHLQTAPAERGRHQTAQRSPPYLLGVLAVGHQRTDFTASHRPSSRSRRQSIQIDAQDHPDYCR